MSTSTEQVRAMRKVLETMLSAVKEAGPLGAPAGPMYAAFMGVGSLEQFNAIMGSLCKGGFIEKRGDCYHFLKDLA